MTLITLFEFFGIVKQFAQHDLPPSSRADISLLGHHSRVRRGRIGKIEPQCLPPGGDPDINAIRIPDLREAIGPSLVEVDQTMRERSFLKGLLLGDFFDLCDQFGIHGF